MQDKISLQMRFPHCHRRCTPAHLLIGDSSPGGFMLEVNPKVMGISHSPCLFQLLQTLPSWAATPIFSLQGMAFTSLGNRDPGHPAIPAEVGHVGTCPCLSPEPLRAQEALLLGSSFIQGPRELHIPEPHLKGSCPYTLPDSMWIAAHRWAQIAQLQGAP